MRSPSTQPPEFERGGRQWRADCPLCVGDWLGGGGRSAPFQRRASAMIAAGVLAVSSVTSPAVWAQEPDGTKEGVEAPAQTRGQDPARNPDFDPGGPPTELPEAPPAEPIEAPAEPDDGDAGPLEPEPANDIEAPVVDPGDVPEAPLTQQPEPTPQPVPQDQAPAPSVTPSPSPPIAETPTPTATPQPVEQSESTAKRQDAEETKPQKRERKRSARTAVPTAATEPPVVAATTSATPAQSPAAPAPRALGVAAGVRDRIDFDDSMHVVRAGECLWSIAADRLGGGASVTRIGREVERLWQRNREQIGTGDPDLLPIGTQLILR